MAARIKREKNHSINSNQRDGKPKKNIETNLECRDFGEEHLAEGISVIRLRHVRTVKQDSAIKDPSRQTRKKRPIQ
jgi:hypothetical protein